MKLWIYLPFALLLIWWPANPLTAQMNNAQLEKIMTAEAEEIDGEGGAWTVYYQDRVLLVLTDEANNRMRIFTPIIEEDQIDAKTMHAMLVANFHTALDAKYSIYEGLVISTFTHPLKELTKEQLIDAMRQVVTLADTFGSTYSSTDLIFGGEQEESPPAQKDKPRKTKRS